MQRALMQFRNPANHALVRKALRIAGREDLIGRDPECLVPPEREANRSKPADPRRTRDDKPARRDNPAHDRKAIRHADKQGPKPAKHGGRPTDKPPPSRRQPQRGKPPQGPQIMAYKRRSQRTSSFVKEKIPTSRNFSETSSPNN